MTARAGGTFDAVLLIAFGGPTAPHEVRPFIEKVARGRHIPPERLELVARQYEQMPGGRSPLLDLTRAQAQALARALAAADHPLPVEVGMRNWHPYLDETLGAMASRGIRRALGIILSPFRTEASWDRYIQDVAEARTRLDGVTDARSPEGRSPSRSPDVVFAPPWSSRSGFIEAVADRARQAFAEIPAKKRTWAPLVFTAHSVPVAMAEGSPYVAELTTAAHAVVDRLRHPRFGLAYQSRSGRPDDPWLEPDINDVLKNLAKGGATHAVVVPIGFVADHVEVLYDLDVRARATGEPLGLSMHRAATVNDHPDFIRALAELVLEARGQ
jgi:protoporphyrin/coproporphyrin ferrochelatase